MKVADLVGDDNKSSVSVDEILTGIGRAPNVEGLSLEAAGFKCGSKTSIVWARSNIYRQVADTATTPTCSWEDFAWGGMLRTAKGWPLS